MNASQNGAVAQPENVQHGVLGAGAGVVIRRWVDKTTKAVNALAEVADLLFSLDVKAEYLEKGDRDQPIKVNSQVTTRGELLDEVKEDIVLGFTKSVQRLLEQPVKGMSDAKKAERKYWQQQVGSRVKDLRRALERREAKDNPDNAPSRTRSPEVRMTEYLNNARKVAELLEEPKFDVAAFCKVVDQALVILNGTAKRDDGAED